MNRSSPSPKITILLLSLWGAGLLAGGMVWWDYSSEPGPARTAAEMWPGDISFRPGAGRAALLMVAHPYCPCTRSSLAEMERLMARGEVDGFVIFMRDGTAEGEGKQPALWQKAESIPGVRVMQDSDGSLAARFGAMTSGHAVFYDREGVRRYDGGLTSARGHEGLSEGGRTILSWMRERGAGPDHGPTFGCPLESGEAGKL